MKAFVRDRYGAPDALYQADVPEPELKPDAVLVRIHATSVNAWDWHMLRGKPYITRVSEGLRQPKTRVLGLDVAGTVEAVGPAVTHLDVGDRAFGSRTGAFAERVAGRSMVRMPSGLSFEEAAAVPTAGQTALQAVRDHGELQPGQRVLINGAGGGVGTFAVQIARALGGEVTAVTSGAKAQLVRSLGANRVVDYGREDFTRSGDRYDLIVDAGGNRSLRDLRRALTPAGALILVAPAPGRWVGPLARMAGASIVGRLGAQRIRGFIASVSRDHLAFLAELIERGELRPVIDRTYAFDELPDAIRHVESGRANGKVVVRLAG